MLGAQVVKALLDRRYDRITATYRADRDAIPDELRTAISWIPLDLPDPLAATEAVQGHDVVIHAAGLVSYHRADRERLLAINRDGTGQMIDAALDAQVSHFIYVGSIAALGKDPDRQVLSEDAAWMDTPLSTPYGRSKYLGELECWRGAAEGLGVSVILPAVIVGSGRPGGPNHRLLRQVTRRPAWAPGGCSGFVDVRDVADFITGLVAHGPTNDRWLLSAGDLRWTEFLQKLATGLGLDKEFRVPPAWLMNALYSQVPALAGRGISPEMIRQLYSSFAYDAGKSRTFPGFTYRSLDQTLEDLAGFLGRQDGDGPPRPA